MDKSEFFGFPKTKTFYGYPISWFEKCSTLNADGWVKDGKIYIDGCSDSQPIRMGDEYRKRAGWN